MNETITIRSEPIELTQLLKFAGLAESGGQAKVAVHNGEVRVNGVVETQARRKLFAGAQVQFGERTLVVKVANA